MLLNEQENKAQQYLNRLLSKTLGQAWPDWLLAKTLWVCIVGRFIPSGREVLAEGMTEVFSILCWRGNTLDPGRMGTPRMAHTMACVKQPTPG